MRHNTSTHSAGVLLPLVFAIVVGTTACEDKKRFSPTSPTPGLPAVQAITITGPTTLHHPGDEGQLTAMARFSDGTTRDISSEVSWSVDDGSIVTVGRGGLLTARAYGQCQVTATYASISARVPVRVMPEGMFALSGRIRDERGLPLWPAQVRIARPASSATTNRQGAYMLPARGEVEVRAEMDGFEPQVKHLTILGDATLDFQLRLRMASGFGGTYWLTFTAAASCEMSAETTRRTYLVQLVEGPPGALSVVVISPEMVAWGQAGFVGTRDGSRLRFDVTDDLRSEYQFVEWLDPGRELAYSGTATGEAGDTVLATFSGTVTLRQRGGAVLARCDAPNHGFEFTR